MTLKMLGVKEYANKELNKGDCIIINTGQNLVIYDCGCEEHAKQVENYMKDNGFDKVHVILSHNDADHFTGIEYLIKKDMVSSITTTLLLKHLDDILNELDDGRRTKHALIEHIKESFDNIASLTGNNLNDALDRDWTIDPCINFVGPSYDYLIEAVAKFLDNSESDNINMETIVNAISVQVEVIIGNHKLLLTGDASFEAIKDKIREYDAIQLPHHGKYNQAIKIFEENKGRKDVIYLVSDNTGNSNGGSDELMSSTEIIGKKIKNTKKDEIIINIDSFYNLAKGCYGYEIYNS